MPTHRPKIKIRRWQPEDIPAVTACHRAAYPDYPEDDGHYSSRNYQLQLAAFPEGQFLAEVDGQVVGYATSLIVQLDDSVPVYRYPEITGAGSFSSHTPSGDTLYGADIAVHPDFRGFGVSKRLYRERKRLLKRYNLRRMVAYGRLPGYVDWVGKLTAEEYVNKVVGGELYDSALNAHLSAGYQVKKVMLDLVRDEARLNYCTVLEMSNPDYRSQRRKIAAAPLQRLVRTVRVCAAQFLMRPLRSWEEFEQMVEFFAITADEYHCHFLLLPEYFTVQLFSTMPVDWTALQRINQLADLTPRYLEMGQRLAQEHRLYLLAGSHPVYRGGDLYNVAHLFTPSGRYYTQDKLHITPSEREAWNIRPGKSLAVFDTPLARIAIQICYDIEFPELARLLALAGTEIIFVPFSTDEKTAFQRVKITAQARAVENYIYTVTSGIAGNLPRRGYLINYAQSAVYTPSDFAFPIQAMAGEADPNVETVVIADLDLTTLAVQREVGSVRPLRDRRPDLYDLRAKEMIKVIKTD